MLNIPPSPNPKEENGSNEPSYPGGEVKKKKRNYEIVDAEALYALNPKLFKLVPDYKKISSAIKLGFPLPGIQMIEETQPEGEENAA